MTKDLFKQAQAKEVGIGGKKCPCCFDKSDSNNIKRRGRKRFKIENMRELNSIIRGEL